MVNCEMKMSPFTRMFPVAQFSCFIFDVDCVSHLCLSAIITVIIYHFTRVDDYDDDDGHGHAKTQIRIRSKATKIIENVFVLICFVRFDCILAKCGQNVQLAAAHCQL